MSLAEKAVLLTFPFLYLILLLTKDKAFLINPFFYCIYPANFQLIYFQGFKEFQKQHLLCFTDFLLFINFL